MGKVKNDVVYRGSINDQKTIEGTYGRKRLTKILFSENSIGTILTNAIKLRRYFLEVKRRHYKESSLQRSFTYHYNHSL